MGLFDFLNTADPEVKQGLLQFGLGLMSQRGRLGPAIGQAGLQSLSAMEQYRNNLLRQKQAGLQQQMTEAQLKEFARKQKLDEQSQALDAAAPQFVRSPPIGGDEVGPPEAPRLDAAALAQRWMSMPGGLQRGLQLQELLKKQAPEIKTAKPGDVGYTYEGGQVKKVFEIPDRSKENRDETIERLKVIYGEGTAEYKQALQLLGKKMTTHQPPVSLNNYGTPLPIDLGDGKVGYLQPPNRPGGPTQVLTVPGTGSPAIKPKELPGALREKLAQNDVTLGKIDKAIELIGQNPDAVGLKNFIPDVATQRMFPKGVTTRAIITDIAGQKIHDRSGAAVTVGEAERLKPYIPATTDDAATVTKKLQLFREEYTAMQAAIIEGKTISEAAAKPTANTGLPPGVRRVN